MNPSPLSFQFQDSVHRQFLRLGWYPSQRRYRFLILHLLRQRRQVHLQEYQSQQAGSGIKARAKTNQANLLNQSFRWLEAYELYQEAIRLDPRNVIATSGAVKVLLRAANRRLGHSKILKALGARYLRLFHKHQSLLAEYGGSHAEKMGIQNRRDKTK